MKFTDVEFELYVADYYKRKNDSCRSRGIEWGLSLVSVRNLLRSRTCPYTGKTMTRPKGGGPNLATDITVDRIDNSKGYVPGNVIACSHIANNFKGIFENPTFQLDIATAYKALGRMQKRLDRTLRASA